MIAMDHMYHMDPDWMWRWHLISPTGKSVAVSPIGFFYRADAERDFEATMSPALPLAA